MPLARRTVGLPRAGSRFGILPPACVSDPRSCRTESRGVRWSSRSTSVTARARASRVPPAHDGSGSRRPALRQTPSTPSGPGARADGTGGHGCPRQQAADGAGPGGPPSTVGPRGDPGSATGPGWSRRGRAGRPRSSGTRTGTKSKHRATFAALRAGPSPGGAVNAGAPMDERKPPRSRVAAPAPKGYRAGRPCALRHMPTGADHRAAGRGRRGREGAATGGRQGPVPRRKSAGPGPPSRGPLRAASRRRSRASRTTGSSVGCHTTRSRRPRGPPPGGPRR